MSGARDADGDSRMSSSSSSDTDNMFPAEAEPSTPQQGSSKQAKASAVLGEISPPHSQDQTGLRGQMAPDVGDAEEPDSSQRTDAFKDKESKEPGWGWKNPKAREEFERSMDYVLDRNFNLREFGELFEEKDIPGLGGTKK